MSHEATIHQAQTSILRELLFLPEASFAELQKPTGLDSDHFKFHISRLVELEYVEKRESGKYVLTSKGKEYANKLDTDNNTIERQPKSAVIMVVEKLVDGKLYYLMQERRKHPYFGFWGFPTGKIRWGETIMQTAHRELMEEAGIRAKFDYCGVYHEHVVQQETGELLEDKIFHVMRGYESNGDIMTEFEGGINHWVTLQEGYKIEKRWTSFEVEVKIAQGKQSFVEQTEYYTKEQF